MEGGKQGKWKQEEREETNMNKRKNGEAGVQRRLNGRNKRKE